MPRPAKSEAAHFLQGTVPQTGRSKTTQSASIYAGGRPTIPHHLSRVARAEYKRLCQLLENRRTLTEGDRNSLAVLSECVARWVAAKRELGDRLLIETTIVDKKGNTFTTTKAHPLIKIIETAETKILALSKALGLTAIDRDKVRPTQLDTPAEAISFEESYMASIHKRSARVVPMCVKPEQMEAGGDEPTEDKNGTK
jgi:P27 family predicted phage terminase small subunit